MSVDFPATRPFASAKPRSVPAYVAVLAGNKELQDQSNKVAGSSMYKRRLQVKKAACKEKRHMFREAVQTGQSVHVHACQVVRKRYKVQVRWSKRVHTQRQKEVVLNGLYAKDLDMPFSSGLNTLIACP
eukprot:1159312-Pelagomonas_calceolata.AAC.9